MGDALATWFEAKTCASGRVRNMRGGASTESALVLAELCYRTLLADGADALSAVETHVVTPALERIVEANTLLSGLGFESSGLAAAHAVHNGLTAAAQTHPYFHGEKVAFGVLVQLILEGKPRELLSEVMEFAAGVGLPIRLADIGLGDVSRDAIERIADRTTAPGETIHNEPFDVEPGMVVDAIRAADSAGCAWHSRRHPGATGNAIAQHDKSEAARVGTSGARSATAVPSLSLGATEEQMNARGTVPPRIDKRGSKVEDLAGTGQQDAPGG
jgi:glycerol dehydrogenase